MTRLLGVCLGLVVLTSGVAFGATVLSLGPQALGDRSEQIFVGVVSAQSTFAKRAPAQVWTRTVFDVERTLKGTVGAKVTLEQLGGAHGEGTEQLRQVVHGYPRFEVGERVLLFLERVDTGRLVVTGLAQGKYTLSADGPRGTMVARRDVTDLALRGAPAKADAHVAGVPRSHDQLLLTHLEALINGLRPVPEPMLVRPAVVVTPQGEVR